ncbi:MAG: hypothetical protein Q8928_06425 [Bacteroidota bacterium]|nr:hypothetical protein [Bacteroidota bacterium]
MNVTEIAEIIKKGLQKGYKQNLLLLSSYNDFIDQVREYLLTVNVAQHLLDWNENHLYKIQIEYPVLNFYNNAFPAYKLDAVDIFNMNIISRKSGHSPTDKNYQKVDLAITEERSGDVGSHERSLVGIELKGINKNENDIIKDAERLAKAMLIEDSTDENSILLGFCGFLRRFDKSEELVNSLLINKWNEEETQRWQNICNDLNTKYPKLRFSIEIFEIVNTAYEKIAAIHKEMDSDYSEVASDTGIVSGGILSMQRI